MFRRFYPNLFLWNTIKKKKYVVNPSVKLDDGKRGFTNTALSPFFMDAMFDKSNVSSIIADVAPFLQWSTKRKVHAIMQLNEEALHFKSSTTTPVPGKYPGENRRGQPMVSSFCASLRVSDVLTGFKLQHVIGGVLAHGVWTLPRATLEVDMDVFCTPPMSRERERFLDRILELGGHFCDKDTLLPRDVATHQRLRDRAIHFMFLGHRFNVCFPLHEQETDAVWALRKYVEFVTVEEKEEKEENSKRCYPFLSKEGLTLGKLLKKRTKDITDLEQMFAAHSKTFDLCRIENHLLTLTRWNYDDPSVVLFNRLKKTYCDVT